MVNEPSQKVVGIDDGPSTHHIRLEPSNKASRSSGRPQRNRHESYLVTSLNHDDSNPPPNRAPRSTKSLACHLPSNGGSDETRGDRRRRKAASGHNRANPTKPCCQNRSSESNSINGEGGIRTRGTGNTPYDGLANRCLQPLGHLSGVHWYRCNPLPLCQFLLMTCSYGWMAGRSHRNGFVALGLTRSS